MTSKSIFKISVVLLFSLSLGVAIAAGMRQRNQGSGTYIPPAAVSVGAFNATCPNGLCTFSGTVPSGTTQVIITGSGPGNVSFSAPVTPPSTSFNFSAPSSLPVNGNWNFSFSAQNSATGTSVQVALPGTTPAYALPGVPAAPSSVSCIVAACTVAGSVPSGADSITVRGSGPSGATASVAAVVNGSSYSASFSNLATGSWTFLVDAANQGGTTTSASASQAGTVLSALPGVPASPSVSCGVATCTVTGSVPSGASSITVRGSGPSNAAPSVAAVINGSNYSATFANLALGNWTFMVDATNQAGTTTSAAASPAAAVTAANPCGAANVCNKSTSSASNLISGVSTYSVSFKANPNTVTKACLGWTGGGRPIGSPVLVTSDDTYTISGVIGDGTAVAAGGVRLITNSGCDGYPASGSAPNTSIATAWSAAGSAGYVGDAGVAGPTWSITSVKSCSSQNRKHTISASVSGTNASLSMDTQPNCALTGNVLTITGANTCTVRATVSAATTTQQFSHERTKPTTLNSRGSFGYASDPAISSLCPNGYSTGTWQEAIDAGCDQNTQLCVGTDGIRSLNYTYPVTQPVDGTVKYLCKSQYWICQ